MRKLCAILLTGMLAALLSACSGNSADDAARAEKYKAAVTSIPHVASVESSYKTNPGMGRSGHVYITADTSDHQELTALLKQAFPAIVKSAEGDPEVGLDILVIPADGANGISPDDLGYKGAGTLTSYRDFLKAHPVL
ncbi:hypothetical protein ACQHIV_04100 [Kribbella sp. GL6]|uniref:hypothetical protein n=1 Tax=Kribbella sp. GL6 TaxID=3419765 RepID=UPI003D064739